MKFSACFIVDSPWHGGGSGYVRSRGSSFYSGQPGIRMCRSRILKSRQPWVCRESRRWRDDRGSSHERESVKMAREKNNRDVCSFQSADAPVGDHLPVAVLEMIAGEEQRASGPDRVLTTAVTAVDYISEEAGFRQPTVVAPEFRRRSLRRTEAAGCVVSESAVPVRWTCAVVNTAAGLSVQSDAGGGRPIR